MAELVRSRGMTQNQIDLVEHALRQVCSILDSGWNTIPMELHPFFVKYMCKDVWTGRSDPLTLREAALMVIRDAITRSGEFADEEFCSQIIGGSPDSEASTL
jgi:hypothetical protein